MEPILARRKCFGEWYEARRGTVRKGRYVTVEGVGSPQVRDKIGEPRIPANLRQSIKQHWG